ncbi:NAD(P)/FAD-dependent oxidoreductase [Pseudanabaena sp. FACHB-2040]|uniref:phytoene desaturase family protein n=1 Tax=Pseudanabaena sp. FACHB-2040 TaxID=2692859 RepID=UPI0016842222|nr:NAD(P)/FAD-dependent oxidoreductase [Pseudanabaena sp. FACHB-2040]MBD2255984.1 NAD(P)/FAD-dependent oxidoreductase [Pseudanabaena sp. FACHB-2040]
MANEPDILIIGAGIAGLAAGCYAQMNGYRTQIFESNTEPGGLCTAVQRQGYTFDSCIHYLFGSGPGQPFHSLWQELGAVQNRQFVNHEEFTRVVEPGGKTLIAYCNPDRLGQHLLSLSPADSQPIKAFCDGVRTFKNFDLSLFQQKPKALMGPGDWAGLIKRLLPFARSLGKWGMLPLTEFVTQFQDPFLKRALPQVFPLPGIPSMVAMSLLAYLDNGNAGFPVGASLDFARALERRYLGLGGEIHYGSRVERILIENDQAVGIRLDDGAEHSAQRVISACDGRSTLFNMLGGQYLNRPIQELYDGHMPVYSQLQVSLGVNRDCSDQPHWVTYLLDEPIAIAGETRSEISVKHYCFDPSLAPPGKSVMMILMTTTYDYWHRTYGRSPEGTAAIQEANALVDRLEPFYPGLKADIEHMEVTTPLTYERQTGNWQGASNGWVLNKDTLPQMVKGLPKTLPGLRRFYMVGQWTELGGGVPIVAMSGRNTIQQICHEDRRRFEASIPK